MYVQTNHNRRKGVARSALTWTRGQFLSSFCNFFIYMFICVNFGRFHATYAPFLAVPQASARWTFAIFNGCHSFGTLWAGRRDCMSFNCLGSNGYDNKVNVTFFAKHMRPSLRKTAMVSSQMGWLGCGFDISHRCGLMNFQVGVPKVALQPEICHPSEHRVGNVKSSKGTFQNCAGHEFDL